jgi:hypothetical protein
MKYFLAPVALAVLVWFGTRFFQAPHTPMAETRAAAASTPASAAPKPAAPVPVTPASAPTPPPSAPAPAPVSWPAAEEMNSAQQLVMEQVLGPNYLYHDDLLGVSATYPEGWKIRGAQRWGERNSENTLFMSPDPETSARPSMYYRMYRGDESAKRAGDTEAWLRDQARAKELSRVQSLSDYANVPTSFDFTPLNGQPSMTYFATFTAGDQVMTEYFIRILGQKGYVMFFTMGKLEDVKTILPQLQKMAGTVKVP